MKSSQYITRSVSEDPIFGYTSAVNPDLWLDNFVHRVGLNPPTTKPEFPYSSQFVNLSC